MEKQDRQRNTKDERIELSCQFIIHPANPIQEIAKDHQEKHWHCCIQTKNQIIHFQPATQNVFKYTQTHREIEVLADTSYCFIVYALAIANNTLLTSSCTLHSRKFPK